MSYVAVGEGGGRCRTMDLKQAYKVLQVPEHADQKEIEKKYELELRKYKSLQREGHNQQAQSELEEINEAYRTIRVHFEDQKRPASSAKNTKWEKVDHFLHYYKWHMIIALVTIILITSLIKSIVDHRIEQANLPPVDVHVMLYGDLNSDDLTPLEENMTAMFPEWEYIDVELAYFPQEVTSEFDLGMQQRSVVTLATNDIDVLILDEENFNVLQDAYQPLDRIEEVLEQQVDNEKLVYVQKEGDDEERLYGVDITNSAIFEDTGIIADKKIATLSSSAVHEEKALQWIEEIAIATTKKTPLITHN
jgi:hypothetical protein